MNETGKDKPSVRGTVGYVDEQPGAFHAAAESITFDLLYRPFLDLLPAQPGLALDIGAGTGQDAAALAALRYEVDAAEPLAALRTHGQASHPSPRIHWIDDTLPDLGSVRAQGHRYDVIIISAVWMHLDQEERAAGMPVVAHLLRPGGILLLTLRHAPVPPGRLMYDVSGDETVGLATSAGLTLQRRLNDQPSAIANKPLVTWTRLAFSRPKPGSDDGRPTGDHTTRTGTGERSVCQARWMPSPES